MPQFAKTKTFALNESPIASADLNSIGGDLQTFLNTTKLDADNIQAGAITGALISSSAAIAVSKLAAGTANQVLINNATPTPAWTTVSGDLTNVLGVFTIANNAITTAKITDANVTYAKLSVAGAIVAGDHSLTNGKIIVGNGSNVGAAVTPSGDVAMTNAGAFTVVGHTLAQSAKTSNYPITNADTVILAGASGGAFTVTLPTAVGIAGKTFTIIKTDSTTANPVTIARTSSQTINGSNNNVLFYQQNQGATFMSDGANWILTNWIGTRLLAKVEKTTQTTTSSSTTVNTLTVTQPPLPIYAEINGKDMFSGGVSTNNVDYTLSDGSNVIAAAYSHSAAQNQKTIAYGRSRPYINAGAVTYTSTLAASTSVALDADANCPAYTAVYIA